MHTVHVALQSPDTTPDAVFTRLIDLTHLPDIAPAVLAVEPGPESSSSAWRARFGAGELRWVQRDEINHDHHRYAFRAVAGDVPELSGHWQVASGRAGTTATFEAAFDLGMPALADQLHPVAAAALIESVESILRGVLSGDALVVEAWHAPVAA